MRKKNRKQVNKRKCFMWNSRSHDLESEFHFECVNQKWDSGIETGAAV